MNADTEAKDEKDPEKTYKELQFLAVSDDVPVSYRSNSVREDKLVDLVQNFQQQFKFLYPKRPKPLLCLPNEYGVQKVVCTTVCPTILPYPELNMWDGCANFIADFLQYEPFSQPTKFPLFLASPEFTLNKRKGFSVNFGVVLCSLLLAAGYDAYVVCGYGERELCLMDEKLKPCPLLVQRDEETTVIEVEENSKYLPNPPLNFISDYEKEQNEKRVEQENEQKEKELQEQLKQLTEKERPSLDPMHGQRVHFWVLVRQGERDVKETFFIEPSAGEKRSISDEQYLGIEWIWNHNNFWINKQETKNTCMGISFDVSDVESWEPFLSVNRNGIPIVQRELEMEDAKKLSVSDMPGSWVMPLNVSNNDFEQRYLGGIKINFYKFVKTEKFSPYLLPNGVIMKISIYKEKDCTELKETHEHYSHRVDRLVVCKRQLEEGKVTEQFKEGRKDCLKELICITSSSGTTERIIMRYYSSVRADGLSERDVTTLKFHEEFHDRKDFLSSREVDYEEYVAPEEKIEEAPETPLIKSEVKSEGHGDANQEDKVVKKVEDKDIEDLETADEDRSSVGQNSVVTEGTSSQITGRTDDGSSVITIKQNECTIKTEDDKNENTVQDKEKKHKGIRKIVETFKRNYSVNADEDIEIKKFSLEEEEIRVNFHTPDERITSSFIEFIKPSADKGIEFAFEDNMWSGFQADHDAKPLSRLHLYQTLVKLMEEEKVAVENVHKAEDEVEKLLEVRHKENADIRLAVVPYDPTRDNKLQEWRSKQLKMLEKDILWRKRMYDTLTPYLARLDFPEELTRDQAEAIYNECLDNFVSRMVTTANNLQKQLNKEKSDYKQKSDYLYHHRSHMTKKQKDEYAEHFKKADLKIRALDMMLIRHKKSAHARYLALEGKLNADPRLAVYVKKLGS